MQRIYFDNAATTPLDPLVIKEMQQVMEQVYGNPSSIHQEGRQAKTLVERCRKTIARLLEVAPGEIFFTSSGTEADNMAIRCSVHDLDVKHIITSRIEHHAVLHSVEQCQKEGITVSFVDLLPNGHLDLKNLESLLENSRTQKTLVTLMHANNEIGNLLDIEAVGQLCYDNEAFFHCDTVQTIGHLPIDIKKSRIHFLSASAHKFNGPKGIGFIFIDEDVKIRPFIHGGAQERNMRGGTENTYGIAGLTKALEIAYAEMEMQNQKILGIKNYMIRELTDNFPGMKFNGDYKGNCLFTVLNVAFPASQASDMLLFNLDIEGIAASGGSACSSGSDQGSHVLKELPYMNEFTSVRFSFGKYNTREEVDIVIEKLKSVMKIEETVRVNP
jgi:cysteine desulfurase